MKTYLLFALLVSLCLSSAKASEFKRFEIPRTQVIPLQNTQTEKHYELYIKLPENYEENKQTTYPVIYFTDAVWHIEILSAATAFMLEDVILVGISWQKDIGGALQQKYGDHASRFTDYSFWTKQNPNHPLLKFGQADTHLSFIRNDVFKYIESNFRVSSDDRTYFGYSLGGLFGAYTLLTQPDTFKNYILGSPSVRRDDFADINIAKDINANVFMSNGDLEKDSERNIQSFVKTLNNRNNKNLAIVHKVIEGDHSTAFPGTGLASVKWLRGILKPEDK